MGDPVLDSNLYRGHYAFVRMDCVDCSCVARLASYRPLLVSSSAHYKVVCYAKTFFAHALIPPSLLSQTACRHHKLNVALGWIRMGEKLCTTVILWRHAGIPLLHTILMLCVCLFSLCVVLVVRLIPFVSNLARKLLCVCH